MSHVKTHLARASCRGERRGTVLQEEEKKVEASRKNPFVCFFSKVPLLVGLC